MSRRRSTAVYYRYHKGRHFYVFLFFVGFFQLSAFLIPFWASYLSCGLKDFVFSLAIQLLNNTDFLQALLLLYTVQITSSVPLKSKRLNNLTNHHKCLGKLRFNSSAVHLWQQRFCFVTLINTTNTAEIWGKLQIS